MINTLDIGKYIYSAITASNDITCRVYPLIADNDAKYPFIVYRRTNLQSFISKDGLYQDTITIEIIVISDSYSESIEIAQKVRNIIEVQFYQYQDLDINDVSLSLATEEFTNNAYVQRMHFNLIINKNQY